MNKPGFQPSLKGRALRLLSQREHSRTELERKLAQHEEVPGELAKGFGFLQSKPATAFAPVAVTPDELGAAWQGGRVHLTLRSTWNGRPVGLCEAGAREIALRSLRRETKACKASESLRRILRNLALRCDTRRCTTCETGH